MTRPRPMPPSPDGIGEPHLNDGGKLTRHASPISLFILTAVVSLGASGLLGRPWPEPSVQEGDARLTIEMPVTVRTGDFYETRIRVHAHRAIDKLQIEISPELWREVTVNSMVPAPSSESHGGDAFRFEFDALEPDKDFLLKISTQINPRLSGSLVGPIRVLDDGRVLSETVRQLRVLP
ncbi:MAG: hypothetical protein EOO24_00335 [Comamonadaceae bacterium]|nr:MAG: hypothetical protein EOO24_00335 [Comamonadaceae bacterium]